MLVPVQSALGQRQKATPKKTVTTPQPATAAGGGAGAALRRPVSTAAGRQVNAALRTALSSPNVRTAVRAEVLRQLRVRRPFAIVNGYMVSAIDLASVYQAAGVRPALLATLGPNGPQLITQAGVSPDRLTITFVPAAVAPVVPATFMRDITATLGVNALKSDIPDIAPIVMIFVLAGSGLGILISLAESLAAFLDWMAAEDTPVYPEGPTYDFDGDGLMNMDDPDDDNDGVPDDQDNYPYDKDKSICDCGRPQPAFSLTSRAPNDFLPSVVGFLTATRTHSARAISLGTVLQGRANQLTVIF